MKTLLVLAALILVSQTTTIHAATPPAVGNAAPNFTLKTLDGKSVELKKILADMPVVLVMLRGWPGYQCPICTRQVQDFSKQADEFAAQKALVVMVYPGPAEDLKAHAEDFLKDKTWPKDFIFVTDPDYAFTEKFGLRWNAKNETAYPSTFIIAKDGKVKYAHSSKTHGDRSTAAATLKALKEMAGK
ncbi:MAG: peroxiredoxin family protein [Verrucomicrobiota bacterium]